MEHKKYVSSIAGIFDPIDDNQKGFEEAKKFLSILSPEELIFNFRVFGNNSTPQNIYGSLEDNFELLRQLNINGAGVYITINKTDGQGSSNTNISRIRTLVLDFDDASRNNIEIINSMPIEPSMVVCTSSGKFHCYFLVNDVPLKKFKPVQQFLNSKYGTDPAIKDLARVMRLPGFFHTKKEPYFYSHIVGGSHV